MLGDLLRGTRALSQDLAVDDGAGGEDPLVVGAGAGHLVAWVAELVGGGELLEAGLPVQSRATGTGGVQEARDEPGDDRTGLLQAVGEVGGADEGLDRVGQDGVLVAPTR